MRIAVLRCLLLFLLIAPASCTQAAGTPRRTYPVSSSLPSGVRRFVQLEMSPTVYNVLYRWGSTRAAPNGAYGPNVGAPGSAWLLEYQRAGATDLIAGVLRRDTGMVDEGLRMFHFGLAREASNGSFPGSAWPFHGTALFLAEAAPALIFLKYSPQADRYGSELSWDSSRVGRAAMHMVRAIGGPGKLDDYSKNHRYYEAALAVGASGILADNLTLRAWSRVYEREGIGRERSDGVMPEDGGHDSGYQSMSLVYAIRYLELAAPSAMRARLASAIARGEAWELSRVRRDGSVNQAGDTRTAGCRERDPAGRCKTTFYLPIANALARWSEVSRQSTFARAAYLVWRQNWALVPGDHLPKPGLWAQPVEVRAGEWLTVRGAGFQPLETVHLYLAGKEIFTVTCDQVGAFGGHSSQPNAHFPIPPLGSGTYVITARGSYGTVRYTSVGVTG